MSLLTIIQNATRRLGLNSPTTAYASTDEQIIQMVGLAQQEGIELAHRHPWQILTTEKTFTCTAAAAQVGAFPSDFDRFIDESFFNRTQKRPVFGPIAPQDWQFTQAVVAATLVESFRVRGGSILITPTPNGTDNYAYEYISTNWCQSSGLVGQATWAADADTSLLDEEAIALGVSWRFLRAKGFDYGEAFRTYELKVADLFLRDGGKRRLNFGQRGLTGIARMPYVSEGSWPLS
jgi:hypothetical protein